MHHPLVPITTKEVESTARSLGIQVRAIEIAAIGGLRAAFDRIYTERFGASLFLPAREIVYGPPAASLALSHGLPTLASQTVVTDSGGLMSYGPRTTELSSRAATYVHRIVKGASPADLPVEQPTKFELVINLKTAKQIGLTIPPNVLARADKVIR